MFIAPGSINGEMSVTVGNWIIKSRSSEVDLEDWEALRKYLKEQGIKYQEYEVIG